jgi:hypothetical protein
MVVSLLGGELSADGHARSTDVGASLQKRQHPDLVVTMGIEGSKHALQAATNGSVETSMSENFSSLHTHDH